MGFLDTLQGMQGRREDSAPAGQFDAQIAETERQLAAQFAAAGELYLKKHPNDYDQEFAGYVDEVKKLAEQKKLLEQNKLAAQGLRLCESCRQTIPLDSVFCNKCGAKMEPLKAAGGGGKFCQSCGAPMRSGDVFCCECGAKNG